MEFFNTLLNTNINKKFEVDTTGTLTTNLVHFWKMHDHTDFYGNNNLTYWVRGINESATAEQWRDQTAYNFYNSATYGKRGNGCFISGKTQGGMWTENQITNTTMGTSGSLSYWAYFILNATHFDGEPSAYNTDYSTNQSCLNTQGGSGSDGLYFKLWQDSSWTVGVTKPALSTWNHWVVTWNGPARKIYCNGALDKSTTGSQSGWKTGKLYVGSHYHNKNQVINGYMCDIGLWNKDLSLGEVQSLYNSGNGNTMIYG